MKLFRHGILNDTVQIMTVDVLKEGITFFYAGSVASTPWFVQFLTNSSFKYPKPYQSEVLLVMLLSGQKCKYTHGFMDSLKVKNLCN